MSYIIHHTGITQILIGLVTLNEPVELYNSICKYSARKRRQNQNVENYLFQHIITESSDLRYND
jgi:hypothetical protein